MTEAGTVFAIPEGWIVHPLGRDRLQRQLSRAGLAWAAVVAEWRELPRGSNYVVDAERRARTAESDVRPLKASGF